MPWRDWAHLRTTDFNAIDRESTVALLPVAALEQHGPHLPLATDAEINRGLVARLAARLPAHLEVLGLPPVVYGVSPEHAGFPGTVSLAPETAIALWTAIGDAVARAGVKRLLILNTHGGQGAVASIVALALRARHGMAVAVANSFELGPAPGLFADDEVRFGLHGGEIETSMMLALAPELVTRSACRAFPTRERAMATACRELRAAAPGAAQLAWCAEDLNPEGVTGDAAAADPTRGAAALDALAARLVAVLEDLVAWPLPGRTAPGALPG